MFSDRGKTAKYTFNFFLGNKFSFFYFCLKGNKTFLADIDTFLLNTSNTSVFYSGDTPDVHFLGQVFFNDVFVIFGFPCVVLTGDTPVKRLRA